MVMRINETVAREVRQLPPMNFETMPKFENVEHKRLLEIMHYLMPGNGYKQRNARFLSNMGWVEWVERWNAKFFEQCVYTCDLIVTKHVNMCFPLPDQRHQNEAKIIEDQLLPGHNAFQARVQWLMLNVTIDLNGLSNDEKVNEIKNEIAPFIGLKQADVMLKVHDFQRACEDGTVGRIEFFLSQFAKNLKCDIYMIWEEGEEAYFHDTQTEKAAIEFAMDPIHKLTKMEDLNKAFRYAFYARTIHGSGTTS